MRCMVCDYSPTAPSLFNPYAKRGVKLHWDEAQQGWTCGNGCGTIEDYDPIEDLDVEVDTGEAPLSKPEV